jgi:hypothetical protein
MYRNLFALGAILAMQAAAFEAGAAGCTAGNPNAGVIESTPTSAFIDNGNGTVTHILTGLMWKRCIQGASGANCATGAATAMPWRAALVAAVADTTAGFSDWRLPNKKELESIVEFCGYSPAFNQTQFPFTGALPPTYFWSASSYAREPSNAWFVNFDGGNSSNYFKTENFAVRLVRGGKSFDAFDAAFRPVVVEYRNTADFPNSPGGHFFYSSDTAEQAAVDAGSAGKFFRTGRQIQTGGTSLVCRFYGSVTPGPNSHFFTADVNECNSLKAAQITPLPATVQQWNYESLGYATTPPITAAGGARFCPTNSLPVYRAYNNAFPLSGPKNPWDSNHRYTSQPTDIADMIALGWRDEGLVYCSAQ